MADQYAVVIQGLTDLKNIDDLSANIEASASRAINAAIRRAYTNSRNQILKDINFPASYLSKQGGRFQIKNFASKGKLEASITAQRRPTSLARFAKGTLKIGGARTKAGVRVEVTKGAAVRLNKAFPIKLRAGNSTDTQFNLGIAIRLPPGQRPRKSREGAKKLGNGLWLLYGPSVQQAFVSKTGTGVAQDISPETADFLEREFLRLVDLKL